MRAPQSEPHVALTGRQQAYTVDECGRQAQGFEQETKASAVLACQRHLPARRECDEAGPLLSLLAAPRDTDAVDLYYADHAPLKAR